MVIQVVGSNLAKTEQRSTLGTRRRTKVSHGPASLPAKLLGAGAKRSIMHNSSEHYKSHKKSDPLQDGTCLSAFGNCTEGLAN